MDITNRQYGKDHSDNIIDELLTFNNSQSWTTIAGSGSATIDSAISFEGNSSLKIENTVPINDFAVSNSIQSTPISQAGKYNFSFYMLKSDVNEVLNLEVSVFKGASLYNAQQFEIGSVTAVDDVNDKWVRFMSHFTYEFSKGDDITFTFNLKGNTSTTNPVTKLWLDGIMLSKNNLISAIAPSYIKPDRFKNLPNLPTADGDYKLVVSGGVYTWVII